MSWPSIRRRLERLESCVIRVFPNETPLQHFVRLYGFDSLFRPATVEACASLAEVIRRNELICDPPDSIERELARMLAELSGEPDPYGTDGLSDAERRAWDWADYHEKELLRLKELAQEEDGLPIGLRELRGSDTMGEGNRELEQVA